MSGNSPLVGDVMRANFVVIDGMATVADAIQQMFDMDSEVLIVDKRRPTDEHGIVLLTDIVSSVLAPNRAPGRVNVYEIMSKPVVTVKPTMSVKNCARLFANIGISTAPVVDNDTIVGIISYSELAFGSMQRET